MGIKKCAPIDIAIGPEKPPQFSEPGGAAFPAERLHLHTKLSVRLGI